MGELANVILAKQQLAESKRQSDQQLALQLLTLEMGQQSRLKEVELQGTIQEFYDLKKEREEVGTRLSTEYSRLDPKFTTEGFASVANTFQGVAEGDMSNLLESIDLLSTDINKLKAVEQQLAEQKSYYKGQEQAIAGLTRLVDPGEFESFVEEYKEKYPDRPTAGLYAGYEEGKVDAYQRGKAAEDMQATSKAFAQSNWTSMRELAADDTFEVTDYTEDEVLQNEIVKMISFKNYPDVINYMNAEATGKVKDVFYEMFPSLMGSMEGHVASIDAIETEFLGAEKETHVANITNKLLEDVSGASIEEAFKLYKIAQGTLTNEADKRSMFIKMEEQLGKGDLGKQYTAHLGKKSKLVKKQPIRVSLKESVLEQYDPTEDETQAEQIYEALDTIKAEMKVDPEGLSGKYVLAGPGEIMLGPSTIRGETTRREEWSPGKAMFGGLGSLDVGFDSPYYDAFYNEVQDQFSSLVSEEDPFGPDFLYSGMAEEHQVPELIKERYGDAVWEEVFKAADEVGKKAQIKEIESILKKRSGEDYWDLIRALDAIK